MSLRDASFSYAEWRIEQQMFNPAFALREGAQFALANGAIGVRGGLEEIQSGHACFLPGAYSHSPLHYHESFPGYAKGTDTRLTGPGLTAVNLYLDGDRVDFEKARILNFYRALDLRTGALHRTTTWMLPCQRQIEITAIRAVPLSGEPLCATHLTVRLIDFKAVVRLKFPVWTDVYNTPIAPYDPRISTQAAFRAVGGQETNGILENHFLAASGDRLSLMTFQQLVGAGSSEDLSAYLDESMSITVDRFVSVIIDAKQNPCAQEAGRKIVSAAAADGIANLIRKNNEILDRFWEASDVEISGDEQLQGAIRFNLFHLFQSASRNDEQSIATKGLTGEGYEGHCFWDTEAFMLPVLALTAPTLARHILKYRIGTLDKAIKNAQAIGHKSGALYPRRTIAGEECSAHYPTGSAQYHINAAIAYGLEFYISTTGDKGLLDEGGAEMLYQTARIWMEIGGFNPRQNNAFCIHSVTGPDEYSALVNNNFYTNAMAKRHLRYAVDVARERGDVDQAEVADWNRAATYMWLPVDPATGVHPQDDGFMNKPLFDITGRDSAHNPLLAHYHPMMLYRHRLSKQGDVVQAQAMGATADSLSQIQRDFGYYEPLTTHDSTLSAAAFAIAAAKSGLTDNAIHYHQKAAYVDIKDLHKNTSHGCHLAAMAGSWLALALGWGGLSVHEGKLSLAPFCPENWKQYRFRFTSRGSIVEAVVGPYHSLYTLIAGSPTDFSDYGRPVIFKDGSAFMPRPAIDAVIFGLDGVITDTAELHFAAWKRLCDEEGIPLDRGLSEDPKSVDSAESLKQIAAAARITIPDESFKEYLARKNNYYRESLATLSPADVSPGVERLLIACRDARLKIGLASAGQNASEIVSRLGIAGSFDFIADSATYPRGKPHQDIFLGTAKALGVDPARCIGVENSIAGITAINAAGMLSMGVGNPIPLSDAQTIVPETGAISVDTLFQIA